MVAVWWRFQLKHRFSKALRSTVPSIMWSCFVPRLSIILTRIEMTRVMHPIMSAAGGTLTHRKLVTTYQVQFGLMALLCSIFLLYDYGEQVLQMNAEEWGLAAIFPLLALGYYGTLQFGGKHFNLRNLGLLKPFIIGFIWAGAGDHLSPTLSGIGNGSALRTGPDGLVIFPKEFCVYQHPLHSL